MLFAESLTSDRYGLLIEGFGRSEITRSTVEQRQVIQTYGEFWMIFSKGTADDLYGLTMEFLCSSELSSDSIQLRKIVEATPICRVTCPTKRARDLE